MSSRQHLEEALPFTSRGSTAHWMGKGFWAITDQGLFAASNFGLNVLLARWLPATDYGAFSVAYTIFLLLGTVHTAILTEPMLVFGAGKYSERLSAYLAVLLRGHWRFGAFIGILFAVAGLGLRWFGHSALTLVLSGLAVASPFILFQWLMRRACYASLHPRLAASSSAIYLALMAAGVVGLRQYDSLGAASALLVMAVSSLVTGLWLVSQLRVENVVADSELTREAIKDHWDYGRWAVGTAVLMWVPGNSFLLLLPTWWGFEASAAYRATLNLLLPVMNFTTALGSLLLPTLVRLRASSGFRNAVSRMTLVFLLTPLLYWLLLGFFGEQITQFLYGGRYSSGSHLLWLAGLIPVLAAASNVSGAALRALNQPNRVFVAYIGSTSVAMTIGLALVWWRGVAGALVGWFLAYTVTATLMALSLRRRGPTT